MEKFTYWLGEFAPIAAYIGAAIAFFNGNPLEGFGFAILGGLWEISNKLDKPTVIIVNEEAFDEEEAMEGGQS